MAKKSWGRRRCAVTCIALLGVLVAPLPAYAAPPDTEITDGPTGPIASKKATFTFEATKSGATFECRLDGGKWKECESPQKLKRLKQGSHDFEVRARKGRAVDATPATAAFTVDTVAPDTTIVSGPDDVSDDHTPSFEFSSNEGGVTFECGLDGEFEPCASPFTPDPPLSDDTYEFEVRARDAAGNVDGSPASDEFTIESPLREDFETALEAHGLYFLPDPVDFDAPASCGGSVEIDCVDGAQLPPSDQIRLDTTSVSITEITGQSLFDVSFIASVETLAPIKLNFGGMQCDLTFDSSNGVNPTWRTDYDLDFRPADVNVPEPYLAASNVVVTEVENDDWEISGNLGCQIANPGAALIVDAYEQMLLGRIEQVGYPLCARPGPGYLRPCPLSP